MSCLRQSVSFHSIAHETGLQGLFLALPISAAAMRAQFSPQIHAEIQETLVADAAPSQSCLLHIPAPLPYVWNHAASHPTLCQKAPAN